VSAEFEKDRLTAFAAEPSAALAFALDHRGTGEGAFAILNALRAEGSRGSPSESATMPNTRSYCSARNGDRGATDPLEREVKQRAES
jgi:hypothetical protein